MAGNQPSLLRFPVLIVVLVALSSLPMSRVHAQQSGPPQASDGQGAGSVAPKQPSASEARPGKEPGAASKPATAGEGIPALVVDGDQMQGVLGKQVRSSAGEDMGRIVDVIIDKSARVRGAVIDFGGFLGVGNRQIAVAWNAIRLPGQSKSAALVVDFTRDQLRVAPAYKAGEQVVLLGPADAPPAAPANAPSDKEAPRKEPLTK